MTYLHPKVRVYGLHLGGDFGTRWVIDCPWCERDFLRESLEHQWGADWTFMMCIGRAHAEAHLNELRTTGERWHQLRLDRTVPTV